METKRISVLRSILKMMIVIAVLGDRGVPSFQNAFATEPLTLEKFLIQVRSNNTGVKGALLGSVGSEMRSEEGKLLLAPTLYTNIQTTSDAKLPQFLFFPYDNLVTNTFSLGISKLTDFGLEMKFHYDVISTHYNNAVIAPEFPNFKAAYVNGSPVLELSQSLWSNGFGRSTRANQELIEAQAIASEYNQRYSAKTRLVDAEVNYWRLALARETVRVQREALDRAKKIYDWNVRRARLHLTDQSDVLQAEALTQSRDLELTGALNEERAACRVFNSSRNILSNEVEETLLSLDIDLLDRMTLPERASLRDDVRAAQENSRVINANAIVASEKNNPVFEVYTSLALNGQRGYNTFDSFSETLGPSFSLNRPTETFGVRFRTPLDIGLISKSKEGWRQEQAAADLAYNRKLFEQEQSWKDLNQTLLDTRKQLELAQKLEQVQKAKLSTERDRLHRGRSTTYQVLLFETDYLTSQLLRLKNQVQILGIMAQMKLFGDDL